jgi:hypothetical protein
VERPWELKVFCGAYETDKGFDATNNSDDGDFLVPEQDITRRNGHGNWRSFSAATRQIVGLPQQQQQRWEPATFLVSFFANPVLLQHSRSLFDSMR